MTGYVNDNLEARGRDVRFDLKRKCCRAWVQVEYGLAAKSDMARRSPNHSNQCEEAIITHQPVAGGGGATLAGEGRLAGKPAVGVVSHSGGGNLPITASQWRGEDGLRVDIVPVSR